MKVSIIFAFAIIGFAAYASAEDFPQEFLGSWSVGKSENLDEYLSEKGYGWFTRQLVKAASITKTFTRGAEPGRFTAKVETTKKDVEWVNVPFNEYFEGDYVDGGKHKIKFYYENGALFEDHKPVDTTGEAKAELYKYEKDGTSTMIMYMTANGVTAKRWYNKN